MRTSNLQHSTDWESAYQGNKKIELAVVGKPTRRHQISSKQDLSSGACLAFYLCVAISVLGYIYYLNQETIIELVLGKKLPAAEETEMGE